MHDAPSHDDLIRKAAHVHEHVHDNVHVYVDVDVDVLVHVDVGGFCSIAPGLPLFISFTRGSLRLACN